MPETLEALSGEERRRLYGMIRLEVAGALSTSGPRSTPGFTCTKQPELWFRASLVANAEDIGFECTFRYCSATAILAQ